MQLIFIKRSRKCYESCIKYVVTLSKLHHLKVLMIAICILKWFNKSFNGLLGGRIAEEIFGIQLQVELHQDPNKRMIYQNNDY